MAAVFLVGAPLGRLLPGHAMHVLPLYRPFVKPKPAEEARYVLAILAAIAAAGLLVLAPDRLLRTLERRRRVRLTLVVGGQIALLGVLIWGWAGQFKGLNGEFPADHFHPANLLPAALVALVLLVGTAIGRLHWGPRQEPRWASLACPTAALALAALWLAPGLYRELNLAHAPFPVSYPLRFTFDDFASVLDGRTPLVDYNTQYAALAPFATEPALQLFGLSVGVFTTLMCGLSLLSFLFIERSLALVARNELAALLLFLPLIAVSLIVMRNFGDERYTMGNYFAVFPIRYVGPCWLLWLTMRHLRGLRPRSPSLIFFFGTLVAINNLEFGLAGLCASLIALVSDRLTTAASDLRAADARRHALVALSKQLALGVASGVVLLLVFLLLRTGELPQLSRLLRYDEIYGSTGFNLLPTPDSGLHIVIYVTYFGALLAAAARLRSGARDGALTGALAFSGLFGLGIGSYYMGRSHPEDLVAMFGAWALSLSLLALLALPALERGWRAIGLRRVLPVTAVMLGIGLCATAIDQIPSPWTEWRRIRADSHQVLFNTAPAASFVRSVTRPGQPVVLFSTLGHVIAREASVNDVSPYSTPEAIVTYEQLDDVFTSLRVTHGNTIFVEPVATAPEIVQAIEARGFHPVASDPARRLVEWRREAPARRVASRRLTDLEIAALA